MLWLVTRPEQPLSATHAAKLVGFTPAWGRAILKRYNLTDPALARLALIVRGADTADKGLTPESPGLTAIAQGFSLIFGDDHAQLAAESTVYDALYAYCQRQEQPAHGT